MNLLTYDQVTLVPHSDSSSESRKSVLVSWLHRLGRFVVHTLTQNLEPQVRQVSDRQGHHHWLVYDPHTGRSTRLASEQEVAIWLENLYR